MTTQFNCPSCGAAFTVGNGDIGKTVKCAKCGRALQIPAGGLGGVASPLPSPQEVRGGHPSVKFGLSLRHRVLVLVWLCGIVGICLCPPTYYRFYYIDNMRISDSDPRIERFYRQHSPHLLASISQRADKEKLLLYFGAWSAIVGVVGMLLSPDMKRLPVRSKIAVWLVVGLTLCILLAYVVGRWVAAERWAKWQALRVFPERQETEGNRETEMERTKHNFPDFRP